MTEDMIIKMMLKIQERNTDNLRKTQQITIRTNTQENSSPTKDGKQQCTKINKANKY